VTMNVSNALKPDLVKSNLRFGIQLRCGNRRCRSRDKGNDRGREGTKLGFNKGLVNNVVAV
jgi:hypothetical protein